MRQRDLLAPLKKVAFYPYHPYYYGYFHYLIIIKQGRCIGGKCIPNFISFIASIAGSITFSFRFQV